MQPFSIVFLTCLIMASSYSFCANVSVNKKYSIGIVSLIALLGAFIMSLSYMFISPYFKAIVSFIYFACSYWYFYSRDLYRTLTFCFTWFALIIIYDTLVAFSVFKIFGASPLLLMNCSHIFITYNLVVASFIVLTFNLLLFILKKRQKITFNKLANINKNFLLTLFFICTALTLAVNSYLTQQLLENIVIYATNFILIAFYIMLFSTYLYTNVMWGKKTEELEKVEDDYNNLKLYTEIVENLMDDLRVFKHDYNNTLSTINGYLENNEVDQVQDLVSSLLKTRNHSLYTGITPISKIEDSGLKGLLTTKVYAMVEKNIHVELDIVDEIQEVPIDMLDLCRMLGVFLDNALEAALHSDRKYIGISFIRYEKNLNVIVANSLAPDPLPPIAKMSQKGFSTKGEGRGLGLYSVHTLLEKYPEAATLNTLVNKDLFIQDLSLDYP